ncbi:MAG: DNA polymerase III subunit delta [Rhodospirillaceae bacterium]|nr:DNA polymerase III subunit delta [Rhodospirillaceae bacterium]
MKITGRADAFAAKPDPKVRAVLLYGPDAGLIRERLNIMTKSVAGAVDDPFRVSEFAATVLKDDPARLGDEAAAMSLTGGRRVVRVRDADDFVGDLFVKLLETAIGDSLVIVTASELTPRSKLRVAFEEADNAAALPCYADDSESLESVIRGTLKAAGLQITPDALGWLSDRLGGDRELSRRELEKLILYKGPDTKTTGATISEDDVLACIGDTAALGLDDLTYAMADGDQASMQRVFGRLTAEGTSPISILTAVARHMMRLHETRGRMAEGKNADQAMMSLRPPVFFKLKSRFQGQAQRWNETLLARGLDILMEAEMAAKSTDIPTEAAVERALLQLAQVGRSAGRR